MDREFGAGASLFGWDNPSCSDMVVENNIK